MTADLDTLAATRPADTSAGRSDPPELHLVLRSEWPIALCGENVSERFTERGAGMDRCAHCLTVAAQRGLGRPGWV